MSLTRYKEINELLQQLLLRTQSILKNKLIGMYIGGSLVNDSFYLQTSDIDCYVITTSALSKNRLQKIEEMHNEFHSSKLQYAQKIEISYIPKKDLMRFDPNGMRPYFNEGRFYLATYGNNFLIELYVLREKGITILGPDIKRLIKEIPIQNLKLAIQKNLQEYWEVALNDLSKFTRSDYQAFAILTMCRTIYSLQKGSITSKTEAAQWAIKKLDADWQNLIEQALTWRPGCEINKLEETRQFVRYVLNKCHDY